jgi:hypothetical protein
MRLPCPTEGESIFPVHVDRMKLKLYYFPYDPVHLYHLLLKNNDVL